MSLIKESINGLLRAIISSKNKILTEKLNKVASFFVVSAILPAIYLPSISLIHVDNLQNETVPMKLDISKKEIVVASNSASVIVPGESQIEKQTREKVEADTQARALAIATTKTRDSIARERRVYNDSSNFDDIYIQAQNAFGVDARILKAVHTVETGRSGSTDRASYAGAQGPMQFLHSTWRRYGIDGNGDEVADINNVEDAIFAAANYLKACGYPDVKKALWGYNPSFSYYNKVMSIAYELGF